MEDLYLNRPAQGANAAATHAVKHLESPMGKVEASEENLNAR
jgi:hypothetical protein